MFSGIIEAVGTVYAVSSKASQQVRLVIVTPKGFLKGVRVGASVAVQGVCLTVIALNRRRRLMSADVIPSTYRTTTIHRWSVGEQVNLERALSGQASFDGHIVQGHVTGTATVRNIDIRNEQMAIAFAIDSAQADAIVSQGSIAINGISLTISECSETEFEVQITPYTHSHTTIQYLASGMQVNTETDIFLRYLARQLSARTAQKEAKAN